ncbi:glycosyltransferase family 2 protein [Treponema sp.]|uniref:glycosyltransferase family 2 protein n=1 Tax=Treponema sp. TaxID=166 RepID=UPI0025F0BA27|nr:glycosyltransferase family 2 protein [Treponema sp.]MCR5217748.1 glycosyltransferase [Treponema sp.]
MSSESDQIVYKDNLVSIIMPCYNGSRFLEETINSVLSQSYDQWELLVVDDGSTDLSLDIVKKFMKKDDRITYITQENSGCASSRNMAIKVSSGRYIAFLDSDDVWHKDYLSIMLNKIQQDKCLSHVVFYSGYRRMNADLTFPLLEDFSCPGERDYKKLLMHCPVFPSAAIVDRFRLKNNVFFRESLMNLRDDYVFFLDILRQGLKCVGFDDILVDYRMRNDSVTGGAKRKMIRPQWNVYHNVLRLSVFKSAWYLCTWAINGIKKYHKKPLLVTSALFL